MIEQQWMRVRTLDKQVQRSRKKPVEPQERIATPSVKALLVRDSGAHDDYDEASC